MQHPFFYIAGYTAGNEITLDENTSRYIVQVLRMKKTGLLHLTDGRGALLTATITDDHKKHCTVHVNETHTVPPPLRKITIGISLLKNTSRFEWFLEKATEMGISEIIPLICDRTEKQKFRADRMQSIVVSAMLQSQQAWLPQLHAPIDYELLFRQEEVAGKAQKFIAHCLDGEKSNLSGLVNDTLPSQLLLIGPEGDFTPAEIDQAIGHQFIPVALGATRLRTETAGVVAAALLKIM